MPEGNEIPEGWIVVRVEKFYKKAVKQFYLYLCKQHTIKTTEKQGNLFT